MLSVRRHAIAPKIWVSEPGVWDRGLEPTSTVMRTFDSDERRLQDQLARMIFDARLRSLSHHMGPRNQDVEECLALAEALIVEVIRPHIHRTIEDAIG